MVAAKGLQEESFKKNLQKNRSLAFRLFYKLPSIIIMSCNFRYQPFVDVSGSLIGKIPAVDEILPFHEQQKCLTTSIDEKLIEFAIQTDRKHYVLLEGTYLALKLKFVKGLCF